MTKSQESLELDGCRPAPLSSYLKALGVLRLVTLHADRRARGCWKHDCFVLQTRLGRSELIQFFLEQYRPTPIIGPWGARSGFFPGSSENSARQALEEILQSDSDRLKPFRDTITAVKQLLKQLGITKKQDATARKFELLMACRAELPDEILPWLDATYVLLDEESKYPPLLGTGGNEGSGSYMSGFAQQVVDVVVERNWDRALPAALFHVQDCDVFTKQTPGHFSPEAAGGPNASTGFDGAVLMNPWEYLLTVEGTLLFAAAAARKLESASPGTLTYPFCVRQTGAGYGSAAATDAKESRAEMWLPLWSTACGLDELIGLFGEGRANVGRRRARDGVDFARAVATLGIDRGIDQFERYGFQVRNGLSTFAVPLGRFHVRRRPGADLLSEVDHWLDRFRSAASSDKAPGSAARALRRLENAIFELCRDDGPENVRQLLMALGQCEAAMARSLHWSVASFLSPIPPLSKRWLAAASRDLRGAAPGATEFRLAASLASIKDESIRDDKRRFGPLRQHLEPVRVRRHETQERSNVSWLDANVAHRTVVWNAGSLVRSMIAILRRRAIEATQKGAAEIDGESAIIFPGFGRWPAALGDVSKFIASEDDYTRVNDRLLDDLLWGLILVDWERVNARRVAPGPPFPLPLADYALLKLCHLPAPVRDVVVPLDSAISARAASGDLMRAIQLAARRLTAHRLKPSFESIAARWDSNYCQRLCAALLFPVSSEAFEQKDGISRQSDIERLARLVLEDVEEEAIVSESTNETQVKETV